MDDGAHFYVSTACLHGLHKRCGVPQLSQGDLSAPHCKFCDAVCACPACRHDEQSSQEARLLQHTTQQLAHRREDASPRAGGAR